MATPFEIAETDTSLLTLYGNEVYSLARSIVDQCRIAFDLAPEKPETGNLLAVGSEVNHHLLTAANEAARLNKILFSRPRKPKPWSQERWQFHRTRADYLRRPLERLDLSAIRELGLRNSIEHYDEYLDRQIIKIVKGRAGADQVHVVPDMAITSRTAWEVFSAHRGARVIYLRVYISDERVMINLEKELNFGALHDQCQAIVDRLDEYTGGGMSARHEGTAIVVWVHPRARDQRRG